MARANDRAVPVVVGERPPRPPGWKADLWVAIERVPKPAARWDDFVARWDDPSHQYRWDDLTATSFSDATCDVQGLEIELGSDDPEGRIEAGHLLMTLDDPEGRWSQYDAWGRLIAYEPGSTIAVWATIGSAQPWWVFYGVVAAWREQGSTVEVEAFDPSSDLNQPIGDWVPGVSGQKPDVRAGAILDLVGYAGPRHIDVGQNDLHSYTSTATPLEELHATAASDGGLVGFDSDGGFVMRNRAWPGGRLDQTIIRKFSDNVCTVDHVVQNAELTTDDDLLVDRVQLDNVQGLVAVSQTAGAGAKRHPFRRSGDLWMRQADGDALAAYLIAQRSTTYVRVEAFELWLHDPLQNVWREGIDLRLGDLLRFIHDRPDPAGPGVYRTDLTHVVRRLRHQITPASWVVAVGTTRAVGNVVSYRWDTAAQWDQKNVVWSF